MSDTFSLTDDVIDGPGSYQGDLASSYTNWVADQVADAAQWIAYQWYVGGDATPERLEIAKQIAIDLAEGDFVLEDLFLAAQTKGSATLSDITGSPEPTLMVNGEVIELKDFFGEETALAKWDSGPTKQTVHHYRELLTNFESGTPPEGWDEWQEPNQAPVATPIVDSAAETLSIYVDHELQNDLDTVTDPKVIDLSTGATDPDGDALNVVGTPSIVVTDGNGDPVDFSGFLSISGNDLTIEQNSRALDALKADESYTVVVTYTLDDGNGGQVETSATITINGSLDEYKAQETDSVFQTFTALENGNGNFNGNVLSIDPSQVPANSIDEDNFVAKIQLSGAGFGGNDKGQISDSAEVDWLGGAIKVDATNPTSSEVALESGALADGVSFNASFNNVEAGDSITVTLTYTYDYWFEA